MRELIDAEYENEMFEDRDLTEAVWRSSRFVRCRFRGSDLREATTDRCVFDQCDFTAIRGSASVHRGSAFTNCTFRMAKLFGVQFIECKLTGSTFEQADLTSFVADGGEWSYVNLRHQSLTGRGFKGLRLVNADLYGCDLRNADLRGADLSSANVGQVQLRGADLRGATLDGIDLAALDLNGVRIDLAQAIAVAQAHGAIVDPS